MNAVITGATKGIGKAIATRLAGAGYNIAVCARDKTEVDDFCAEIKRSFKVNAIGLATDCSDKDQLHRFSNFVQQHFQFVDVLINNVGTYIPGTILDEPDDLLLRHMAVNVYAAHYLSRFFGRKMREHQRGHIINICSIASKNPVVSAGSYSVTKAALLSLTHVLRQELMAHHVKVTAILPGSTLTDSWAGTELPENRFVLSEDIASSVLLALQLSAGATVQELIVTPAEGQI